MIERRANVVEFRVAGERRLTGYAATFGTRANIGSFTEEIAAGAFRSSLAAGADILALADHDPAKVLARTRSGTLQLSEDDKGLAFDMSVPDTQAGHDVLALAQRGDLGGMSFGFMVPKGGDTWSGNHRTLRSVDLMEISVVSAWPAYPNTVVIARSRPQLVATAAMRRRYLETI
jgi:hypothetical protein